MEAIKNELNEKGERGNQSSYGTSSAPEEDEFAELTRKLVGLNLPDNVLVIAQRELKKAKKLQPSSAEYSVSRNYLEWLAALPWNKKTEQSIDISKSKAQLDQDHFGLQHVKKRIIEYLSVIKIKGDLKAPILCFVGPVSFLAMGKKKKREITI